MNTSPFISFITPVYNEEEELPRLVELFMAVRFPIAHEWIFVDDHSTDGSLRVLQEYAARHPIKVLEQERNRGKGAALKRGFDASRGKFVLLLDGDLDLFIEANLRNKEMTAGAATIPDVD